jgi:hypothetical protein
MCAPTDKATTAETDGDARLMPDASMPPLSDGAPGRSHTKGIFREALAVQIPAVILWDDAGGVRRTESGDLIQANVTIGSRGGGKRHE